MTPPQIQSNCQGLQPVYDNSGNLIGHRGVCDVDRWNGTPDALNSLHPIDTNIVNLNGVSAGPKSKPPAHPADTTSSSWFGGLFGQTLVSHPEDGNVKFKQPSDLSLFDWLSPHHDIIRNHPQYRHAHLEHRRCIHKKRSNLFDFLGSLVGFGSGPDESHADPYTGLPKGSRCLNTDYYQSNPFMHGNDQYDLYSLYMGKQINNLRGRIDDPTYQDQDAETLTQNLNDHYDRLNRHLDCHCHHELPQSQQYGVYHRPVSHHSMQMISYPNPDPSSMFPSQLRSSMPLDHSMDMEDEHMSLMRLSGLASQHAYNSGYFTGSSPQNNNYLRMQMFHPVNPYGTQYSSSVYSDPEWNRLRVEKVIVIKRLKVPVVQKVSVPVPVPVPYPIMVPNPKDNGPNGPGGMQSPFANMQAGQIANNTFLVDSSTGNSNISGMIHAISGAPCGCFDYSHHGHAMDPTMSSMYNNPMGGMYAGTTVYNNPMLGGMSSMYNNPMMSGLSSMYSNPMITGMNSINSGNPMMSSMESMYNNPMMADMNAMYSNPMMMNGMGSMYNNPMTPGINPIYNNPMMGDMYNSPYYLDNFSDRFGRRVRGHALRRISNMQNNHAGNYAPRPIPVPQPTPQQLPPPPPQPSPQAVNQQPIMPATAASTQQQQQQQQIQQPVLSQPIQLPAIAQPVMQQQPQQIQYAQ